MRTPRIKSFQVRIFRAELKRPFITALGRKTRTVNVGIELRLSGGACGYGEASSSLALAHLTPARLARALRGLGAWSVGRDPRRAGALIAEAWDRWGTTSPAAAAFECALLEAEAASRGLSLRDWLGGKLDRVESDITLSAWDAETAFHAAQEAARDGFRILKVKVGTSFAGDLARVRAAHRGSPEARFYLDGNQGMTVAGALRLVEACLKDRMTIELLEQPLPKADYAGMRRLARRSPVTVAADEMVSAPADAQRVAEERAAGAINIKVAKSGILRSLEIAAVARAAGLRLMIGCMAETARGLAPSVHLALGTGFFRYVDLDSDCLLAQPPGDCGWVRRGPFLSLS